MSIFDHHSNSALHRYESPNDDSYIEVGYDPDPIEPSVGEYRLLTFDDKPVAHGAWDRRDDVFQRGDKELFESWHHWEEIDKIRDNSSLDEDAVMEYLTYDARFSEDEAEDFLNSPRPTRVQVAGFSQGDYSFAYFPADTTDSDEQKQSTAQLLANYSFGSIYLASYYNDSTGDTTLTYSIEAYDVDKPSTDFIMGNMSWDEAVDYVENILRED